MGHVEAAQDICGAVCLSVESSPEGASHAILCEATAWIADGDLPPAPSVVVAAVVVRLHEWIAAITAGDHKLAEFAARDAAAIAAAMGRCYG